MAALARLMSSSCANQVLDLFTSVSGILTDVDSVSFQIYDKSTGVAVQVYPTTPSAKQSVDVDTDCPTGDRLGVGHYVARWDVPANENLGTHQIKWYFKLDSSSSEQTFIEEFEVLAEVIGSSDPNSNYCLVQDIRDEGVTTSQADDGFLQRRIALASRFVEAATKRFFYPKALTFRMDGTGGPVLLLNDPIISIEYVKMEISPLYPEEFTLVQTDIMRVYNRHISQNLQEPDDRDSPKIELFNPAFVRDRQNSMASRLSFPQGQQNLEVKGVFGYTEFDGSTKGKTPELIRHVAKLIVFKELAKMARSAERSDARNRYRIVSENTRDQGYALEPLGARAGAFFTGDPEIDNILASFSRPTAMGAV